MQTRAERSGALMVILLVYAGATLLHYSHNAAFLHEYPNMPEWLTPARVCAAWVVLTAVGLAGYLLFRWRHRFAGLVLLATYAAGGLDGLTHYGLAPLSAHTPAMHLTIGLEAAMALLVLAAVARLMLQRQHHVEE
jgi:hypothetical protein